MAGNDTEVVIWYRPRVRLWRDETNEWHLAGEPDGVAKVVSGFRQVARGIDDSVDVELRTDAIPTLRNPVEERGVAQMFERLTLERTLSRKGSEVPLRIAAVAANVRIQFSHRTKHLLGYALLELLDGEGDFSLEVEDESGRSTRLWFWGYSNPHGVDGF
jgi:hypothetical protein